MWLHGARALSCRCSIGHAVPVRAVTSRFFQAGRQNRVLRTASIRRLCSVRVAAADAATATSVDATTAMLGACFMAMMMMEKEASCESQPGRLLPEELLSEGELGDRYEILEEIGSGAFASVHRAVKKGTGVYYAIKKLSKVLEDDAHQGHLTEEVRLTRSLGHDPRYVTFLDVYEDQEHVYFVMELCHGVSLFDWINQCSWQPNQPDIKLLLRDMLRAIAGLEEIGILHLDVKLENFIMTHSRLDMVQEGETSVKLADFGIAEWAKDINRLKMCDEVNGTVAYMAPELLQQSEYSSKCDVYSCGVVGFALFTLRLPCEVDEKGCLLDMPTSQREWERKVRRQLRAARAPEEAQDLVARMLSLDPATRLSAAEALKHPFLQEAADRPAILRAISGSEASRRARASKLAKQAKGCRMFRVVLSPGEFLYRRGERGNEVYFILESSLPLECMDEGYLVASHGPGEVVGVTEFFSGGERKTTVRCSQRSMHGGDEGGQCRLLRMPASSIEVLKKVDLSEFHYLREIAARRSANASARAWLRKHALFRGMSFEVILQLAERSRLVSLQSGAVLLRKGEPAETMYLVQEGALDLLSPSIGWSQKRVCIGVGSTLAAFALLPAPASVAGGGLIERSKVTAVAAEHCHCEVLELTRRDLYEVLDGFPGERAKFEGTVKELQKRGYDFMAAGPT
eukprot:TRINITY_DN81326_c0_g1_i1.p1 TRINITY_DN81326_c0_g1~~TRINITY_DN81326_c0_g1_i1.p1  ORF type:complete len:686 (+),score=162.83 TRINITY_DN81326_c0_g1_i1:108-2165(+)